MKTCISRRTRLAAILPVLIFSHCFSQVIDPDDPTGVIGAQLTSAVKNQFGNQYNLGFQVLDSIIARSGSTSDNGELSDPYGTLKGYVLFGADKTESFDDQHGIMGLYRNGQIVWHSDSVLKGYWGGTFTIKDINQDGKVDMLVEWTPGMQLFSVRHLWIISWDGSAGTLINQIDPEGGNSTLVSEAGMFEILEIDSAGPACIRGYCPDNLESGFGYTTILKSVSTFPAITYGWNGSQYGLWPGTRQIPADEFLPANLLSVSVKCAVKTLGDSLAFQYYWTNNPASRQCMSKFSLFGVKKSFFPVELAHWDFIGWMRDWPVAGWEVAGLQKLRYSLPPGNNQEGVLIHAWGLPAIVKFYIQGYRPEPDFGSDWSTYKERSQSDFLSNSFVGTTIGPVDPPVPVEPLTFLDTLTSFTTQSRTLGWITSQTVAEKYVGYFSTAKTQLEQNNTADARTTLQLVLHDVDVDSSSTLTSEAYALLRYNTEYLLDQLPAQSQEPPFAAQVDSISASLATAYANGWIGAKAFVNSLDRQLANARKNLEKGNLTRASALLQNFLNRLQKVYRNTLQREQKGKRRPTNFVTEEGFTYLSGKTSELLTKLGSLGEIVSVPGQFTTIQAAINAAKPGATIEVDAGTYKELVEIQKRDSLTLLASENVTIQGVRIARSNVITVKGFTIDAAKTNKDAVQIEGQENTDITIEANEIVNSSKDGISTGKHNVRTRIVNNVIAGNEKNGIDFADGTNGAQYVINNTIVKNGWNGVEAASQRNLYLVNNIISFNGTAKGDAGGRYGVKRDNKAGAERITLLNNLIVGNDGKVNKRSSKDIANFDEVLDGGDSGNITTSGKEGIGVSGSSAQSFSEVLLPDYRLDETSIAIDKGIINFAAPDLEAGMLPDEDIDGSPRPQRATIDLGAFEIE